MNEYVFVQFIFEIDNMDVVNEKLEKIKSHLSGMFSSTDPTGKFYVLNGKILSSAATLLYLQDQYIAERMKISYISDELKNKFRQTK